MTVSVIVATCLLNMQLRMLMVTVYVADGLRAPSVSVEMFAEPSQQVLMRQRYVTVLYIACASTNECT